MKIIEYTKRVMHSAVAHHLLANAQPNSKQWSQCLANSPQFIQWAWCHIVWNIHLISLGQLSSLYSLTASCAPSQSVEHGKLKKSLTWYKHYLATTENISVLST